MSDAHIRLIVCVTKPWCFIFLHTCGFDLFLWKPRQIKTDPSDYCKINERSHKTTLTMICLFISLFTAFSSHFHQRHPINKTISVGGNEWVIINLSNINMSVRYYDMFNDLIAPKVYLHTLHCPIFSNVADSLMSNFNGNIFLNGFIFYL